MSLKNFIRRIRRKLGIYKPTDWEIRVERDQELTAELLRNLLTNDANCVDVGANIGAFLEDFVALAPHGEHIAFEPIPEHAASLAQRFPDVRVLECALSDKVGEVTFFHVPNRDAWSGLKRQNYPDNAEPVEITVDLKRLDDIVGGEKRVDFIKIDVEGAEYEVLKGAVETLKRCHPTLLFEHAKLHNEHYGTTPDMMFDLLDGECGMDIYDLALSRKYDRQTFIDVYEASYASNYDRNAETNFVARPTAN